MSGRTTRYTGPGRRQVVESCALTEPARPVTYLFGRGGRTKWTTRSAAHSSRNWPPRRSRRSRVGGEIRPSCCNGPGRPVIIQAASRQTSPTGLSQQLANRVAVRQWE